MEDCQVTDEHGGVYYSEDPLPPLETLREWRAALEEKKGTRKQLPNSLFNGSDKSDAAKRFDEIYQKISSESYAAHPFVNYAIDEPDVVDEDGNIHSETHMEYVRDPQYEDNLSEDLYAAAKLLGLVE